MRHCVPITVGSFSFILFALTPEGIWFMEENNGEIGNNPAFFLLPAEHDFSF